MRQALANILVAALSATSLLAAQPPNIPGSQASNRNTGNEVRPEKGRQHNSVVAKAAVSPSAMRKPLSPIRLEMHPGMASSSTVRKQRVANRMICSNLPAAHRRLPLGTLVKVTNLRNNRSVIVRVMIAPRAPYANHRFVVRCGTDAADTRTWYRTGKIGYYPNPVDDGHEPESGATGR